jgi:hypothetical protein
MGYDGDERRVHRVYVTRNTEYHVRRAVCVAVRPRASEAWDLAHPALGRTLEGALRLQHHGVLPVAEAPEPGDLIYFRREERDLITSRLERVERPARAVVESYPV